MVIQKYNPSFKKLISNLFFLLLINVCHLFSQVDNRPNIILIMADDMGYSDIGAYGGEIQTPTLDSLAANGLRYKRFYNAGRCCPTRATLLTGLYPHQSGLGHMVSDGDQTSTNGPGYAGEITSRCVTLAEVLKTNGYSTYMVGKWHVSRNEGISQENLPNQRGFDRFFGLYNGASNYFTGSAPGFHRLASNNTIIQAHSNFYFTKDISDTAVTYINEHSTQNPFFMYVAYTAPHWPLNALPEDIARYRTKYMGGWDKMRTDRLNKMKQIGLADDAWQMTPRDAQPWTNLTSTKQDEMDYRMSIYAAQVDNMDQGIGKIVQSLKNINKYENTLILFLGDNGGNHEGGELGTGAISLLGQKEGYHPGSTTILSYGRAWGNASNTPFRRYKSDVHEGGIATPLIAHWPEGILRKGEWDNSVTHIIDIMPTFVDLAEGVYPKAFKGNMILPMEGISITSSFLGNELSRDSALVWEHEGNRAVMQGKWKLVAEPNRAWELYNLDLDRSELNNLAGSDAQRVINMTAIYNTWAERTFVHKKTNYNITPGIKFITPSNGSSIPYGNDLEITWGAEWRSVVHVTLEYTTGNGWQSISDSVVSNGNGTFIWRTPNSQGPISLRVTSFDGVVSDSISLNLVTGLKNGPVTHIRDIYKRYDALGRSKKSTSKLLNWLKEN